MNKKIQTILWVLLTIIVAGLVGLYIYKDSSLRENIEQPKDGEVVVDAIETITSINDVSNDKGYTVELVSNSTDTNTVDVAVPELDRSLTFSKNTSDDAKKIIIEKIDLLVKKLKKDNSLFQYWIDLGLYRKIAGDYEGAQEAWEYVGAVKPNESLSFRNLGDLYGYYLKDSVKAEENLLKAIENDPNQIEYYFKTVEFYREVMKNNIKARQIAEQGIKSNPNSKDLIDLLESLK